MMLGTDYRKKPEPRPFCSAQSPPQYQTRCHGNGCVRNIGVCELNKCHSAVVIMALLFISQYNYKMFPNIQKTVLGEGW